MKFKSYFFITFISLFILSCSSSKKITSSKKRAQTNTAAIKKLPSVKQKEHVKNLVKRNSNLNKHTLAYIKKYAPLAVISMHNYKIPASITLAQGVLESGNGRSNLASKSNNHFGIKCHRGWKGQKVYHDDDKAQECFRKYTYVEHSYNDHSNFLTGRKRYAFLFKLKKTNYKAWAKGLKKAGYATDKKYPKKLIKIIETYKLYAFDKVKKKDLKKYKKEKRKPVVVTASTKISTKPKKNFKKSYTVKKGDTLYSIARKNKISVSDLKKINSLKNNTISIGQKLRLK